MATTYIAGRRINVNGSFRNRGDAVPEAASWKNLNTYLRIGHVIKIDTDEVTAFQDSNPVAVAAAEADTAPDEASPYEGMTAKDLAAQLKARGLTASSRKKADILAALIKDDELDVPGEPIEADATDDEG